MADPQLQVGRFLRAEGVARETPLLLALSGGADSLALLYLLASLGQRLVVAHVHHGLRPEAEADLAFARAAAAALSLGFDAAHVDAATRDGRSPEARARALRYAALERLRQRHGAAWIATAHTLDDQAETVLLRAARGTGPTGLAGIEPRSDARRLLRPLLRVRRTALRAYLSARRVSWREDASNLDLEVPRNRVRRRVLPELEALHPGAHERLAQLADHARLLDAPLETRARRALAAARESGDGGQWLCPAPLLALEPACRRRALGLLLVDSGLAADLSARHLERCDAFLVEAPDGAALSLPRARALLRDGEAFWLGPATGPRFPQPVHARLNAQEALEFPRLGWRLSWQPAGASAPPRALHALSLAPDRRVQVRSPRPGERVPTRRGHAALQDLWSTARWSRRDRARTLVIEVDGEVAWVPGLTVGRSARHDRRAGWRIALERLSGVSGNC